MTVLYRNANRRRGGLCVMARPTCGVLGANIPSTGVHGAALAYASLSLPADAAKGYAIWIEEHGFPEGILPPNDDTSLTPTYALPQGVYPARITLIENDVDLAPTFTAQVTSGTPPAPEPLFRNANERRPGLLNGAPIPSVNVMQRPKTGVFGELIAQTGEPSAEWMQSPVLSLLQTGRQYAFWLTSTNLPAATLPPTDFGAIATTGLPAATYTSTIGVYEWGVPISSLTTSFTAMTTTVAMAYVEPGADIAQFAVQAGPDHTAAVAYLEPGADTGQFVVIPGAFSASVAYVEPGSDTGLFTIQAGVVKTATVAFVETGSDTGMFAVQAADKFLVAVDYIEPAGDVGAFAVQAGPDHTAIADYVEPAGDQVSATIQIGLAQAVTAEFQYIEPGTDIGAFAVEVAIKPPTVMSVVYLEPGSDSAAGAVVRIGGLVEVGMAYAEPAGDIAFARFEVPQVSEPGMLARLAAEFEDMRRPYGLYVESRTVLECAINATRKYVGWTDLCDATAHNGLFSISGSTRVRPGEWALIEPLFRLYVERETALVLEATRASGVELVGRTSSEVITSIEQYERDLGRMAFYEDIWTVGICEEELELCEPIPRAKPKRLC